MKSTFTRYPSRPGSGVDLPVGRVAHSHQADQQIYAVGNGFIYTGGSYYNPHGPGLPGTFSAYRMSDGSNVWNSTAVPEATFDDAPALANGVVYSDDSGGEFVAYNAQTGAVLWTYQPAGEVHSSGVIANGTFYQCANDGYLYAFTV